MEASILDLRKNMGKVLKALDMNQTVKLTYRGKDKAIIIPVGQVQEKDLTKCEAFGMWAERTDNQDVAATVRNIRKGRVDAF